MSEKVKEQKEIMYRERLTYEGMLLELLRDLAKILGDLGKPYSQEGEYYGRINVAYTRAVALYNSLVPELRRELKDSYEEMINAKKELGRLEEYVREIMEEIKRGKEERRIEGKMEKLLESVKAKAKELSKYDIVEKVEFKLWSNLRKKVIDFYRDTIDVLYRHNMLLREQEFYRGEG